MDKRGVVVGWVSSSREPSSRKTIEQCVSGARQIATALLIVMIKKPMCAHVESCFVVDAKRGVLINILGVGASLLPGGMATSRPTDERRNGLRPARANTDTGLRRFGPLLPGIRSKDQDRSAGSRPRTPGYGTLRGFLGSMRPFSGVVRSYSCRYPSQNTA